MSTTHQQVLLEPRRFRPWLRINTAPKTPYLSVNGQVTLSGTRVLPPIQKMPGVTHCNLSPARGDFCPKSEVSDALSCCLPWPGGLIVPFR